MAARSVSFAAALEELASLFHRARHCAGRARGRGARWTIRRASRRSRARLSPEAVQLAYQICVQGRADLPLAPDEATGFSMTLLRLLAFEPASGADPRRRRAERLARRAERSPDARRAADADRRGQRGDRPSPRSAPRLQPRRAAAPPRPARRRPASSMPTDAAAWPGFVAELKLAPMAAQLAAQTELKSLAGNVLTLALPAAHKHLADKALCRQAQGRARPGDRPQVDARLRGRVDGRGFARGAEESRAGRGEVADRGGVPRRAVRAGRARRFDARIKPDSIKPLLDSLVARRCPWTPRRSSRGPCRGRYAMMKNQLAGLMKQAQQMQDNMKKAQEELARIEVEGQSGAGLVKVVMTCRHDVKRVTIDPSLLARGQGHARGPASPRRSTTPCAASRRPPRRRCPASPMGMPMPPGLQAAVLT